MDSKSDSGSGSGGGGKSPGAGGGGGGTGSAPMFTEEQIPNAFLDNLQKVFDLLKRLKTCLCPASGMALEITNRSLQS